VITAAGLEAPILDWNAINTETGAVGARLPAISRRLRRFVTPIALAFAVLATLAAIDAAHEILHLAGSRYSTLIDSYFYDIVAAGAGILMVLRGALDGRERAWLLLGIGTLIWCSGDLIWDFGLSGDGSVTASDPLWLSWYPLAATGIVMMVRSRISGFDVARWIDGIAVALVVATPGVALALQPALEESRLNLVAHVVLVAYPACDVLLLGAAVGVIGLAGWRPGRMWYLLAAGLALWVIGDALYAVTEFDRMYRSGVYDYLWPTGLLLVAAAAWQPRVDRVLDEPYGWQAVALPIAAQVFALVTQVWGLVAKIGESERIMTSAVLVVVILQLCIGRPRRQTPRLTSPDQPRDN
jgi:hypothetical protein